MNVQIADVISDVSGATGMPILDAILRGERNRHNLAELADTRIQVSKEEIAESLEGNSTGTAVHPVAAKRHYREYYSRIREYDEAFQEHLEKMEDKATPGSKPGNSKEGKRAGVNAPRFDYLANCTGLAAST